MCITQRIVVIPYRRFGKTYRSQLQPSKSYADEKTDGQTGRHNEANSSVSQFCEHV